MVVENFDFLKFCVQIFLNNKYIVLLHKIILIFSFTPSSYNKFVSKENSLQTYSFLV